MGVGARPTETALVFVMRLISLSKNLTIRPGVVERAGGAGAGASGGGAGAGAGASGGGAGTSTGGAETGSAAGGAGLGALSFLFFICCALLAASTSLFL